MAYAILGGLLPEVGSTQPRQYRGRLWAFHPAPDRPSNTVAADPAAITPLPRSARQNIPAALLALRGRCAWRWAGLLACWCASSRCGCCGLEAALRIAVNQLRDLLGLTIPSTAQLTDTVKAIVLNLDQVDPASLAVGLLAIGLIVGLRQVNKRIPGPLIAIIVAACGRSAAWMSRW
jgi:hypothetical protein